ncbi:hypothetical protein DI272_12645 [Streptomyces sp. Act143]|uniref:cutinase family protein n=1 Tax=Streptomyces sp. Act143 TaxID=2200760 RepID=UPI000D67FBDE|nr:cutinase family protein [Streptomyces sp. Act143]PWI14915.1 hypothetical protein DI272_12645 [Streptomyces sp. Act143]
MTRSRPAARGILVTLLTAVALLTGLLSPLVPAARADDPVCTKVTIIGVRGSAEGYEGPYGMGNTAGPAAQAAADLLVSHYGHARSDISTTTLVYPAVAPEDIFHWWDSVKTGAEALDTLVTNTYQRCPSTRIGLVGYSQGAGAINMGMHLISERHGHVAQAVRGALLIADPFRDGRQSYAQNITDSGRMVSGNGLRGMLRRQAVPISFQGVTRDICRDGDGVCSTIYEETVQSVIQAKLTSATHTSYMNCCSGFNVLREYGQQLGWRLAQNPDGGGGTPSVPPTPAWNPGKDCGVTVTAPTQAAGYAVQAACSQVAAGTWYSWGGGHGPAPGASYGFVDVSDPERSKNDPYRKGFDCSGLVRWAWSQAVGHDMIGQRTAAQEFALPAAARFTAADGTAPLKPGDLVFWGSPIHHVAMYLGDGKVVEARESDTKIMVSDFTSHRNYVGAIRLSGDAAAPGGGGPNSTWGTDVNVRSAPALSGSVVTTFAGPTAITIKCQKHGESVTAEGYTNDAWSYLPDYGGWVNNIFVQGKAWLDGIPACDGDPGGGSGRHSTWGTSVNVRPLPSRGGTPVATFSAPMSIVIQCQKRAESVTAEGYTNDVWSYLPDYRGWVSNIYIQGPEWLDGVPACDGNTGGGSGQFSTWGTGVNTRQRPSVSAPLGPVFSGPTRVTVSCQKHAESVTAEGYTNDAWSYLPDHQAWISNIFLQGPAWLDGVPTCGSSGTPAGNGGHRMWASDVKVRKDSSTATDVVHTFTAPTDVLVTCQAQGQSVTAEGITNSAWSYLPDYGGWISNIFLQGPAWLEDVPACGTTRPGNPPNMT